MKIWFDTEFVEDGKTIDLISIGMVSEIGGTLYLENAEAIRIFAGEKPEFYAYYADYDWVVLCQLYGRMIDLPKGWPMYCRDVKQEADRLNAKLPKQDTAEHYALADAVWTRDAWEYLQGPATIAQRIVHGSAA